MRQAQRMAAEILDTNVEPSRELKHVQPFLQNKAEMSADQTRYGMQSEHEVYELMAHGQYHEIPGEAVRQPMLSLGELHELAGEDHARELDGSQYQRHSHRYSFDGPDLENSHKSTLTLHEYT